MNKKIITKDYVYRKFITALFAVIITFAIYSLITGIISLGELENEWDGVAVATSFSAGNGTEENPYIINNADEFMYFKELIEGELSDTYKNMYYKLGNDINFGNHEITAIGTEEKLFEGHFNGNGYLLTNFKINEAKTIENDKYYSIFSKVRNAEITNLTISNYQIETNDTENAISATLIGKIIENDQSIIKNIILKDFIITNNNINETNIQNVLVGEITENDIVKNIYIKGEINTNEPIKLLQANNYENVSNILDGITPSHLENDAIESYYLVEEGSIINNEEVTLNDVLSEFNQDISEDYHWVNGNDGIIIKPYEETTYEIPEIAKSFTFTMKKSASITLHESGIDDENHIIYVNDLVSDENYYTGLNYTEITNTTGELPSGNNQNLYGDSNLATVYIRYTSEDINDDTIYGSVSLEEDIRTFIYYKKYPVYNGELTFDLIDSPWANRPNNKGFNGWITDYDGAVISLDIDTYIRKVTIPVSDLSNPIDITFYSSWTNATTVQTTNDLDDLNDAGMKAITPSYDDLTQYYVTATVNYNSRHPNSNDIYDLNGNKIPARERCQTRPNCTYLTRNTNTTYNSNTTYYQVTPINNNTATVEVANIEYRPIPFLSNDSLAAGYFIRVNSGSDNVYSAAGEKLNSCTGTCYKLMQYSDGVIDTNQNYYYLVTRDTNIFAPSQTNSINLSLINFSRPMTITGLNNGEDNSSNRSIRLNDDVEVRSDLRIEYITLYVENSTTNVSTFNNTLEAIIGDFHNLKIGRGLKRNGSYLTASSFIGGDSDNTNNLEKYTLIVESGWYQNGSAVGYNNAKTHYVQANVTLGSDYDRIDQNNDNLIIYYCYAGTWASDLYNSSNEANSYDTPAINTIVKSGTFGQNKADYAAGIYVGGRASGTHYAIRSLTVEGGYIYNLLGGPMSDDSRSNKNDIIINVKGGEIDLVFGGAGASNTVGNRIINVTGGTINYSILGGSNAYQYNANTSNPYGKIDGDTLLYVGGNVVVGTKDDELYAISSGNVFGAGNGRNGELDVGSVNNSNIIIGPNAEINGDVYGGGNFGAVGGNLVGTATSPSGETIDPSSSGGVYEDSTSDTNIRYYGTNPHNYIQFNGENYRILGLFNNVSTAEGNKNLVKIIKTTPSTSRTWSDTNMSTVATNTNTETQDRTFIFFNVTDTYNYTNYYKNYYNYFIKDDGTKSSMYTYLNTDYFNSLNATSRDYIQSVDWSLGATVQNQNADQFYTSERSNTLVSYKTGINQTNNGTSKASDNYRIGLFYPSDFGFANNDANCLNADLSTYASSCLQNNWLKYIDNGWTMTPSTTINDVERTYQVSRTGSAYNGYTYNINRYYHHVHNNLVLNSNRIVNQGVYNTDNDNDNQNYYNTGNVYPAFYLKDDITILSGTGTEADPYIIGSSEQKLTDLIYELMHPEEEEEEDPYQPIEDSGTMIENNDYQAKTHIHMLGGSINGSIYGAGNSNGAGNNNTANKYALAQIKIDIDNGTIGESVYGGSNTKGIVYGDVIINVENGTIQKSVYGGGKGGYDSATNYGTYISRNVDVNIGNNNTNSLSIRENVYGGSAFGSVNGITENEATNNNYVRVNINNGTITGSVFGGGQGNATYEAKEYGNVYVHVNNGNMSKVFGGNDSSGSPSGFDIVYLNGGTIGNAFGGGNATGQENTDIRLQGSTITENIYGGSNQSGTVVNSRVTITSGSVAEVYGGNNLGGDTTSTHVKVTGGSITYDIYGGGKQASANNSNVNVKSCTVNDVYGGGKNAGITNKASVVIDTATATKVFGGANITGDVLESNVEVKDSNITSVYGGNNSGGKTSTTNVNITTSTVTNAFGGGDNTSADTTNLTINSGTITNVYGGSNQAGNITNANVDIKDGNIENVFGGNNLGGETTNAQITTSGGTVGTLYGGGNKAQVGSTNLNINNLNVQTLYGGGNAAGVKNNVELKLINSTVTENLYGGGNEGVVQKNTNVLVTDSTIGGNAFAGGNGITAIVQGNSTITINGATTVGSSSSVIPDSGCVFGSGNAASTGQSTNKGKATVNIVGGEIFGNVYGGPKMAVVYGTTTTNIGTRAVNQNTLKEDNIIIHGTVFGGGESNASGSETYDYTFISVTDGIDLLIDGTNYENNNHQFIINGSIFGSGNASSSSGESNITILNLGSKQNPNKAISIQRANNLKISSSVIELSGTTDRTNEYSDIVYSLNLIDKMVIQNNTTLLLHHNSNMLKELYSGLETDQGLTPATVDINEETQTVTKNVDNRIYMLPNENLHVTVNQAATAYGRITGMTFFGMYTVSEGGQYRYGLYDETYNYGDAGNAGLEIVGGSYVIGLRLTNHDITKNGFYTNYLKEETFDEIVVNYIEPTQIGETGYRWTVGFEAIDYTVPLQISKYSSLGTYELSLMDFANGNTTFTVLGFDSTNVDPEISIVDSENIPRVGRTEEEANSLIGLAMKVETQEWTSSGTVKFLGENGGSFQGNRTYQTDNRKVPPSLMFYSYHTKNFSRTGDIGSGIVTMQVSIPKNAIEYEIKFITITIEMEGKDFGDGANYDGSITYDKKYEMPAATTVNITNNSQFTAYFSLTDFFDSMEDVYGLHNEYYHAITTSTPLPVGTMITMLDYGANPQRPEYYYFTVTQDIYNQSLIEYGNENDVSYYLRNFIKMDSTSQTNLYNDQTNNLIYFDSETGLVDEEFIFIVDFKNTNVSGDHLNNKFSFELRNGDDWPFINVVSAREPYMLYSTYESSNIVLSQTFEDREDYLYYNIGDEFTYKTKVLYNETENRQSVIDTNYEYSSMGLNISFLKDGETVSSSLLVGSNIFFNNQEYYADGDGIYRIKLADKVSNIEKNASIVINKNLPSGNYTMRYVLFASPDGLHNSKYANSVIQDFPVTVVSADNSITATCGDDTKLVDGETGLNHAGSKINTYKIEYTSQLSNPNIHMEVLKRNIDDINTTQFTSVDFQTLFKNHLQEANDNEVYVDMLGQTEKTLDLELADELTSGTYRIVFKLYDNNQLIDQDIKYVIVTKN